MYNQIQGIALYMVFYGTVAALSMIACCYLLFRRANAIAPDITSSVRLRRWTAAFFASIALGHVWYMPTYILSSSDDVMLCSLVGSLLDCMTFFPLEIIVLLAMLQDRKRPLWPVALMLAPPVAGMAWGVITRSDALMPMIRICFLLLSIGLIIYMVREVRRYGRWLRDNYADLEHKEVWQSFLVLAVIFIASDFYVSGYGLPVYEYVTQMCAIILVCYLLWRVETLSDLSISQLQDLPKETEADSLTIQTDTAKDEDDDLSLSVHNRSASPLGVSKNIEPLLKQYCDESRFYLQYDITLSSLARKIGINRFYLSQYFSSQDMNYNTYINDLRINHFITLYREAVATHRPFTVQQLACESGYRSYSTFSRAFKLRMGQSVREWECDTAQNCSN